MPIYEYRCKSCGHDVEALQKVSDPPLKKCPECGRRTLARLMSAPSFRLKGGGWYETDFKSDGEKKRNLVDGDGGAKEAGDGKDAKSEAKPEAAKPDKNGADKSKPAEKAAAAKPATPPKGTKAASRKSSRTAAAD